MYHRPYFEMCIWEPSKVKLCCQVISVVLVALKNYIMDHTHQKNKAWLRCFWMLARSPSSRGVEPQAPSISWLHHLSSGTSTLPASLFIKLAEEQRTWRIMCQRFLEGLFTSLYSHAISWKYLPWPHLTVRDSEKCSWPANQSPPFQVTLLGTCLQIRHGYLRSHHF